MATTYAQNADLQTYAAPTLDGLGSTDLERLIQRAEKDIDSIVGPWATTQTTTLLDLPVTTVMLKSTRHFPATGTISVDGQTVTYTGKTASPPTVTGSSGGTGQVEAGSTVAVVSASGLKFDPVAQLTTAQQVALKRATCAQAEYRYTMGDAFFVRSQYSQTSGPDFSQKGELPFIGPRVYRELEGYGLIQEILVA